MFKFSSIRRKLALMGLVLSLPAVILLFLLISEKNKSIAFTEQQKVGNEYLRPLRKILETVPQFERGGLEDTANRVEAMFGELEELNQKYGKSLKTEEKFNLLRVHWRGFRSKYSQAEREKRDESYKTVMQDALGLFSHVGYASHLVVDPNADGFYMADMLLVRLPEQVLQLSEITQIAEQIVSKKSLTADEKLHLNVLLGLLEASARDAKDDFEQASTGNSSAALRSFDLSLKKHSETLEIYAGMLRQKILNADANDLQYVSGTHFNSVANNATTSGSNLWREIADADRNLLQTRVDNSAFEKYSALGLILLVAIFAFIAALLTARNIIKPLDEAVEVSDALSRGEIVTIIASDSRADELGQLLRSMSRMTAYLQGMAATADKIAGGDLTVKVRPKSEKDRFGNSFENMLERTLRLVQSQEERDRLQNSIMKLLEEVGDVAAGDLTAQAEVTEDATGAIADAFNYMTGELRGIIGQVQTTTHAVDDSAARVQTATETLVRRSEIQSSQIAEVSIAIEDLVSSVQKVAESVSLSVSVADQSLENARRGTSAVQNNISAMNRLREQVSATALRIRKLGERSAEITSIVKLIDDVARRANILALNASIQATAAGEAGRGFIVVAEEVERLAVRSSDATRAITALTQAIQGETSEAVASIEDTLREVAVGAKLAHEVGAAVEEIETVSNRLAELNQVVLQTSKQQTAGSESINRAMREVTAISQQTAMGMRESAFAVNKLAVSARELRTSVASFKLPDDTQTAAKNFVPAELALN